MKLKLPDSIATMSDLISLRRDVHEYSRWFAHESIKKKVNADRVSEPPTLSPAAMEITHDWVAKKTLSQKSLDELEKMLKNYNDSSPTITLTLAATPNKDIKNQLVGWLRKNIAPNILVDFRFNSTLLGGMVVHCGSRTFDWSFRRQILAEREKFPEVLRRV